MKTVIKQAKKFFTKLTTLALVFLFFFQPLAPVFAQDFPITSDSANASIFSSATKGSVNAKAESTDKSGESSSSMSSMSQSASGTSSLAISQNQYKLQPKVDSESGAMMFSYPIEVPPGINGLQPNLALSYSSQNTDEGSIFGYGWTLSGMPEISRVNKTGIDRLYMPDVYNWNLFSTFSGELASVGSNGFKAKSDDGSFLKYIYDPASQSFTVKDKNGTTYIFGANSDSRIYDQFNTGNIYKWMVSSITDSNGNTITFYYNTGSGRIYPAAINYGPYQILFIENNRNDVITNYKPGFYSWNDEIVNEIQVKFNVSIQKKYTISYKAGDNGKRSLLSSVQASGYDQQGNLTTEPATTFNYSVSSAPNWVQSSSVTLPPNTNLTDGSSIAADINGDGYTDILTAYQDSNGAIYKYAYLNKGDGTWVLDPAYTPPDIFISRMTGLSYGWTAFDLNGDRLPDLLQSYKIDQNPRVSNTYLNTGSGWALNATNWGLPVTLIWNNNYGYQPNVATVADMNGDGFLDLSVYRGYSQYGLDIGTALNYSGLDNGFRMIYPDWNTSQNSIDTKSNYSDVNADGVDDLINENGSCSGSNGTYVGNGNGVWYMNSSDFNSPHSYCYGGSASTNWNSDWGGRVFDINSDGLPDLVYSTTSASGYVDHFTYLNTGSGWTANQSNFVLPQNIQFSSSTGSTIGGFIDLNGDGIPELYSNNTVYVNQNAKYTDLLNSISYPTGGTTSVAYKSSAQYKDASGNLLNPKLPIIVQTVNTITTNDPVNNITNTDTYTYADGYFYYYQSNLQGKKFSGFGKVTKTNLVGNKTISYFHTASGNNGTNGVYVDFYPEKIGKMFRQETYGPDGKIYTSDTYKWDIYFTSWNSSNFVFLDDEIHQDFNGQSDHKDTATTYAYDNANGNLLTKTNYGKVLGDDDGTFSDVGADGTYSGPNDDIIATYTYATDGADKYQVSGETLTDAIFNKLRETKYYYDNLPLGQISNGNQTKEEAWISGANYATTQKGYNNFGLVTNSRDAKGNNTSNNYDGYNLYPTTVTNALNQSTYYNYNYTNGKVTQIVDNNGNVFKNTYDGLGRIIKIEQPDQTDSTISVTKTTYIYNDTPGAVSVQQTNYLDSSNSVSSYNYHDGLGRIIQTKKSAENNNFETKDFVYDNRGNLQKESLPYFTTGSGRTSATGDSTLYTSYNYDAVGRVVFFTNSVGTTTNTYSNWKLTTTDANGKSKDLYTDAYGNLIQVDEHNLIATYSTFYTYDYLGNPKKITDALGNVRNFTYNALGQRTRAEDLHAPSDTTFGTYSYAYDNVGNLISLTDPKNQTINYAYDALNRKISEDYAGKTGVEVTLAYDNCPNGKGLLCDTISASQTEKYEYSATGNITKDTKTIDAKNYVTQYSFDRQGNQILITNPDNSQIKNIYNSAGLLEQIDGVANNFDYSPTEQITNLAYANGTQTTNTYDSAKLYRLLNKTTTNTTGTQLQNLAYTYDNVGNITQLIDSSTTDSKKTVAYTYDSLYRLLSSTATGVATAQQTYAQNFAYDALGNILSQTKNSETTSYEYKGTNPDAVTKTATTGVTPLPVISYFTSSPSAIISGQQAVLSWAISGGTANTLSIDNSVGSVLGSNFKIVNPTETTTYVLAAVNDGGTITKPITITVNSAAPASTPVVGGLAITAKIPPVIDSFSVSQSPILKGQSAVLSWAISGGKPTTLSIDNSVGSVLNKTSKTVTPTATKTYKLTAKNSYGSTAKSVTVIVNPAVPVISKFTVSPTTIISGNSATLSWTLSGGAPTTLSIDKGVGSVLGKTKITVKPIATTTYTITAVNISGSVTKFITVTVNPPSPIIKSFAADSTTIARGQSVILSWTLSGGAPTTLSIDNSVGSVLGLTAKTITPTATTTYTLTASNISGAPKKSIKITVNQTAPIISNFTANPTSVIQGQSSTLSWTLSGTPATSLSIDNGVGSVLGTTSKIVTPTVSTTYALTAKNTTGTSIKYTTVTVNLPAPVIDSFIADSTTIIQGNSVTLSWMLSGGAPTTLSIDNGIGSVLGSTSVILAPTVTTTYVLTASNITGTATKSVTVTVNPPAPVIDYFYASYGGFFPGGSTNLLWSLSGGAPTSLSIDNGIGSVLGSTSVMNLTPAITTTYTITASNISGTVSEPITVNVYPVISTFTVSPATITQGQSSTLSWTVAGGPPITLSIDNGVGSVLGQSSVTVKPTVTTTYAITAVNSFGWETGYSSVTVYVNPPAPVISSFTASPTSITSDQSATLSWSLAGGTPTSLSIDNSVGSVLNKTSIVVKPTITTTYVLTAVNTAGTVIQPIDVTVTGSLPNTNTSNYTYDANGNMTSDGAFNYTYDYNNRMTSATPSTGSGQAITYVYDPAGQRIKVATATATTIYPTQFYNTDGTMPTKHIFANGADIATVQGTGTNAKIYYTATDSLNSSSVMTDQTGAIVETMDYFPFGAIRLDTKPTASTFTEQRKYIGQEFDADTGLNYLNARYYNATIGRFTSEDPMFWGFDNSWLADPQTQNAYSYGRNNPLIYSDSDGKRAELVFVPIYIAGQQIPGAHSFISINAEPGVNLSQYGNGPHYTIGGYPNGGKLQAQINNPGNLNAPSSSYLATYPLNPPKGTSVAQYDQNLLASGANLSNQNLGTYVFWGQPINNFPNSGNTTTQVILDAGGTVPSIPSTFNVNHYPYIYYPSGFGQPIGTPSYGQQLNTSVRSEINNQLQTVLNSLLSVVSQLQQLLYKANNH